MRESALKDLPPHVLKAIERAEKSVNCLSDSERKWCRDFAREAQSESLKYQASSMGGKVAVQCADCDSEPEVLDRAEDFKHKCKPKSKPIAKGRKVEPEYRSQLEADRAEYLERKKLAGEILAWWYEPCQLQIGGGAKYKPDFLVFNADQSLDFEETKGFWREAHRIRIKTAAARFPIFRFRGITRESGEWQVEEFKP